MNTISVPVYRNGKAVRRLQFTTGTKGVLVSISTKPYNRGEKRSVINEGEDRTPMDYIGLISPIHMGALAEFLKKAKNGIILTEEWNAKKISR